MTNRLGVMVVSIAITIGGATNALAEVSSSIRVSNGLDTPQSSSVDLLKESLQGAGIDSLSSERKSKNRIDPQPTTTTSPTQQEQPLQPSKDDSKEPTKELSPEAQKLVEQSKAQRVQAETLTKEPTTTEKNIEKDNALLPDSSRLIEKDEPPALTKEEQEADAELEYAIKLLEKEKQEATSTNRTVPHPAAQNQPSKVPVANKKFNPNDFRPGIEWVFSRSTHFDIYTQKRKNGISSSNMSMTFEQAYQTLRRFIPWMMSKKVRVFVYQDHNSYLKYEPNARAWSGALAYPTRGEIVVYDAPEKKQELKESFTHELTHIFTQYFFDSHKTGRIMTPTWLDEGLAVYMEDHSFNGAEGGPWSNDYKTINFRRPRVEPTSSFVPVPTNSFGQQQPKKMRKKGRFVTLQPFASFMQEGSLNAAEGLNKTEDWYLQAYLMVRFLLNPAGGASPSNRMQFEQFTKLLSQGEPVRDPNSGFVKKDSKGHTIYRSYSMENALGKAFRYGSIDNFESNFWRWLEK